MFDNCRNSHAQGNIGLGYAIAWFTSQNHTVSIPLNDSQEYDLLVDFSGDIKKIQVKTVKTLRATGTYKVELRTKSTQTKYFTSSQVDYLFALTSDGSQYLIPRQFITTKRSIELNSPKYARWLLNNSQAIRG